MTLRRSRRIPRHVLPFSLDTLLAGALLTGVLFAVPRRASAQVEMEIPDGDWTHRIVLRGDTAWFYPTAIDTPRDETRRSLGYLRSSGRWVEARIPTMPLASIEDEATPRRRDTDPDTTLRARLGPGITLVQVGDTVVQDAGMFPSPVYAVLDARSGRRARLLVPNTAANRRRLIGAGDDTTGLGALDFATAVTRFVADGEHAWFGLWAGIPSVGEAADYRQRSVPTWLGGILRYDFATGRVTPLLHPELRTNTVMGLALADRALWIATAQFSSGAERSSPAGLVRYGLTDSSWKSFRSDSTPMPGNMVGHLASDGTLLFVAADSGVAVLDSRSGRWSVRWFDRAVRNDSVVTIYVPARPAPDPARDAAIGLADALHEPRRGALSEAAHRAALPAFEEYVRCLSTCEPLGDTRQQESTETAAAALAHPAFIPFLARAFDGPDDDARRLATDALFKIADSAASRVLRSALASDDVTGAADVAGRLTAAGDSAGRAWLRAHLRDAALANGARLTRTETDALVAAARASRDSSGVALLLPMVGGSADTAAMAGVIELGTLEQQRELAGRVATRPALWFDYLDRFSPGRADNEPRPGERWMRDPAVRANVVRTARQALALPDSSLLRAGVAGDWHLRALHSDAIVVLARGGKSGDVPLLAGLFDATHVDAFDLAEGLVLLTGEDSAPGAERVAPTATQRAALRQFWANWWTAHRSGFRPAALEARQEAVARWRARHGLPSCCD